MTSPRTGPADGLQPRARSFFEPLPPPEPMPPRRWAPPLWDRPSEGTLPAVLAVNEIVAVNEKAAVAIDCARVYPNGFTIDVCIMTSPHDDGHSPARRSMIFGGMQPGGQSQQPPRVGVRFADGRSAGEGGLMGSPYDIPKDEAGIPTVPVVRWTGGGGGATTFRFGVWVFPLPPPGPVELFLSFAASGPDEHRVVLDGDAIRATATRATVIWS